MRRQCREWDGGLEDEFGIEICPLQSIGMAPMLCSESTCPSLTHQGPHKEEAGDKYRALREVKLEAQYKEEMA
jgi:hypothetical protein